MNKQRLTPVLAACALVTILGCQREEPTYSVSGTVTYNGTPLENGFINFESDPLDGKPAGSAQIVKGSFVTKARAGKKKVMITANKPTGEKDSGGYDIVVNYLPPEFNLESKLTAEVTPAGPNQFEFKLKK